MTAKLRALCGLLIASVAWAASDDEVLYPTTKPDDHWWSNKIIYQVYPRSFKDSDGDGIGDLRGIAQELDHFVDLGIEIVWINAIFKSPMDDTGFDVENHTVIDPIFGTEADFDALISQMNNRGLKLIIDFVPNHSSRTCEWFSKSVKNEGKYGDYYVWRDASNQYELGNSSATPKPPNNWLSKFGGSAWSWNDARRQFYLHQFNDRQPDFNLRNAEVRRELLAIMEFWLDKGVAGFRFSSVGKLYENKEFPDEPRSVGREKWPPYYSLDHKYTYDQPEVVDTVAEWRSFVDGYAAKTNTFPRLLVAESHYHVCAYSLRPYFGTAVRPAIQVPMNFHLMVIVRRDALVRSVDRAVRFWFEAVPANNTPNWAMESHDTDRISSKHGAELVQVFTALRLALPGIEITYYGGEIGMENTYVSADRLRDTYDSGGRRDVDSRDFARSPMQWDDTGNAGFTDADRPWLPVNPNYYRLNVAAQRRTPTSNYNFYKTMSRLRRTDTLKHGDLRAYNVTDAVYIIKRSLPGRESYLVVANFGDECETVVLSDVIVGGGGVADTLYVCLGTENSAYGAGNVVSTLPGARAPLRLRPKSAVVLTDGRTVETATGAAANRADGTAFAVGLASCVVPWLVRRGRSPFAVR